MVNENIITYITFEPWMDSILISIKGSMAERKHKLSLHLKFNHFWLGMKFLELGKDNSEKESQKTSLQTKMCTHKLVWFTEMIFYEKRINMHSII